MRLTHDQRRDMSTLLTHERSNVPANNHAALTLAAIVDPADVKCSVVTTDNKTGQMSALLVTQGTVIFGEFPMDSGGFTGTVQKYSPTIWLRDRSSVAAIRVGTVQLMADQEGSEVVPSFELVFEDGEVLGVPWDGVWKSAEDASTMLRELLR